MLGLMADVGKLSSFVQDRGPRCHSQVTDGQENPPSTSYQLGRADRLGTLKDAATAIVISQRHVGRANSLSQAARIVSTHAAQGTGDIRCGGL